MNETDGLTKHEWEILEECAGQRSVRSWGAAVGAALGVLYTRGMTKKDGTVTSAGWAALRERKKSERKDG